MNALNGVSTPPGIEIIKDKLYFASSQPIESRRGAWTAFSNDSSLVYTAFFADFGPLDLGLTYKFCKQLHDLLTTSNTVVYFSGDGEHARANSAVLLCAFLITVLNYTAEAAYGPLIGTNFVTFRDAGFCVNTFPLTVLDCCRAFRRAKVLGHYSFKHFSLSTYQNLGKLQNGDVSWIIPGKFIAFSGPLTNRRKIAPGTYTLSPEQYIPLFKSLGVTCIVRFNDKQYDRKVFTNAGIKHADMLYEDGSNPPEIILSAFLALCETEQVIAVHCKAGLGRTGTNIAAYMIKHYQYTAKEAIAWCRICRPGSIVGPQQQYVAMQEERLMHEGQVYRAQLKQQCDGTSTNSTSSVTSAQGTATVPVIAIGANRALSAVRAYRTSSASPSASHGASSSASHGASSSASPTAPSAPSATSGPRQVLDTVPVETTPVAQWRAPKDSFGRTQPYGEVAVVAQAVDLRRKDSMPPIERPRSSSVTPKRSLDSAGRRRR